MVFLILKVLSQEGPDHKEIIEAYRLEIAENKAKNIEFTGKEAQRKLKEEFLEEFRTMET